jgi:hypothetical protein
MTLTAGSPTASTPLHGHAYTLQIKNLHIFASTCSAQPNLGDHCAAARSDGRRPVSGGTR